MAYGVSHLTEQLEADMHLAHHSQYVVIHAWSDDLQTHFRVATEGSGHLQVDYDSRTGEWVGIHPVTEDAPASPSDAKRVGIVSLTPKASEIAKAAGFPSPLCEAYQEESGFTFTFLRSDGRSLDMRFGDDGWFVSARLNR